MYQHNQISASETSSAAHASAIDLTVADAEGVVSLQRLRSAVAEIFTALNERISAAFGVAPKRLPRPDQILDMALNIGPYGAARSRT